MSIFYKASDYKQHKIDTRYKSPDNQWHYIKNVYHKATDNKWHPAYTYSWVPGSWGSCSKSCGGGTQTRTVTCTRNDDIARNDVFCNGITKPPLSQACNTHGCYWASDMWIYYGRHVTGNSRVLIGQTNGMGYLKFGVNVSDMCNKGWAHLYLEMLTPTGNCCTTLFDSGNITRRVCSNWREEHISVWSIFIPAATTLYFRAYISGQDNCCRGIHVLNITHTNR